MKAFALLILLFTSFFSYSQELRNQDIRQESKLDLFSKKSGTLIEKEFIKVGKIGAVVMDVVIIKDLIDNSKLSGVKFEYYSTTYGSRYNFIDSDEVDGLIKSLEIMKSSLLTYIRSNYTEVIYQSRSGFEAGAYCDQTGWKLFIKIDEDYKDSFSSLKLEDLNKFLTLLQDAKQKISQNG
jgi:hypothetical protein